MLTVIQARTEHVDETLKPSNRQQMATSGDHCRNEQHLTWKPAAAVDNNSFLSDLSDEGQLISKTGKSDSCRHVLDCG